MILAVLNGYFGRNWRVFTALEREDWDGVIEVLENRIFRYHRVNSGDVRLLVNAYVVRSRTEGIARLEGELRKHKPAALPKNALLLGIPHLLSNDGNESRRITANSSTPQRGVKPNGFSGAVRSG